MINGDVRQRKATSALNEVTNVLPSKTSSLPTRKTQKRKFGRFLFALVVVTAILLCTFRVEGISAEFNIITRIKGILTSGAQTDKWDSSKSVVMGLATNYPLHTYKKFVGSLRATGYSGSIILGIAQDAPPNVLNYLAQQNVTTKILEFADNCTYLNAVSHNGKPITKWKCPKAYPDYKITWARFPLYRDWLLDCPGCTDGVIVTDVRDAYFQRNPFEAVEKPLPLMLHEEIYPNITNTHWLTDWPVSTCKNIKVGPVPVLCSGSTMGSRQGILDYVEVMVEEFDAWKVKKECRFENNGDDQSIHNYLYYTNRFKDATTIPHRTGVLHVAGWQGARIRERAEIEMKAKNVSELRDLYFSGDNWQEWLPARLDLIDPKTGMILNKDGLPSAQVHQDDRFGPLLHRWRDKMMSTKWQG